MSGKYKLKYWITGAATSFLGVAAVRIFSKWMPMPLSAYCTIVGYIIAMGGLFIITLGTRKRA